MASSAPTIAAIRRGDSSSGSPPVRMTSQISGRRADIIERRRQLGRAQARALGPDILAAEAEAAIDRAGMMRLQQHAVGIAMDDAFERRKARGRRWDRRSSSGAVESSAACGTNCRAIGSSAASPVDKRRHVRRDRDGVAPGDRCDLGGALGRRKPGRDDLGGLAERRASCLRCRHSRRFRPWRRDASPRPSRRRPRSAHSATARPTGTRSGAASTPCAARRVRRR